MFMWAAIGVLSVGLVVLWLVLRNSSRRLLAHLTADGVGLTLGPGDQILWGDVVQVRVETTDAGPYDEDVFLVIVARGRAPLRVPPSVPTCVRHLKIA
jgi:hypothetical protein